MLSRVSILSLLLALAACAEKPLKQYLSNAVLDEHQWNTEQMVMLQQLWIGNLSVPMDASNHVASNLEAVALGKAIFFDQRFSSNGTVSCASCHQPDNYFTDGLKVARGINITSRNTPTIVGANHHNWFFHDGRADSLWAQALGPLESADEHGGNRNFYAHLVFNDAVLRKHYEKVFGKMPDISDLNRFPENAGPVKHTQFQKNWHRMVLTDQKLINQIFVNVGKSLAAYQSTLQPEKSRFDLYVEALKVQDWNKAQDLLNKEEASGLRQFIGKAKCVLCHNGPLFSDKEFHNIGTVKLSDKLYDSGRYEGVKKVLNSEFNCRSEYNDDNNHHCDNLNYINSEKHETLASFKTPGLRNITKTDPYMHDGRFETLTEVIKHYGAPIEQIIGTRDLLLPISLNEQEVRQLEAFLKSLDSN